MTDDERYRPLEFDRLHAVAREGSDTLYTQFCEGRHVLPHKIKKSVMMTLEASTPLRESAEPPHTVEADGDASPKVVVSGDQLRGYALFLDRLKDPSASQLVTRVKLFVTRFPLTLKRDMAAERLHTFISRLEEELPSVDVFEFDTSEEEVTNIKEGLEKLILKPLHQHFFSIEPSDKMVDDELALKIARISPRISLHDHLHGPPEFTDDTLLELAIGEFQRIDSYRAPRDKLQCILNGFRVIRHALDTVIGPSKWGADQLLPLCIYSIIRANPPSLQSNINFISHFRHPSRLRGEDEYLLMQMDVAIKDILGIDEVLLKKSSELTISDIAMMFARFQKCTSKSAEWTITEIDEFVEAYRQVTKDEVYRSA
jgi:hypothetical protein